MRLLTWCLALLFALATSASSVEPQQAGGDSPAPDAWPKTVEALGTALSDNDAGALLTVLSEDVSITSCESKNSNGTYLLARTKKGSLITSLSYVHPAETMAGDIAEAFRAAEVPEELKRKVAMRDEAHARRANRTAVTWLTEALGAKQGDRVGVIVFWCDKVANQDPEMVFILVKGDPESEFRKIKMVCFGNPVRASK
jgi:hypothetical protein